jgi:hypothetical protein
LNFNNDIIVSVQKKIKDIAVFKELNNNKAERAEALKDLIPSGFAFTDNFISYNWEPGNTLYHYDSSYIYNKFLCKSIY